MNQFTLAAEAATLAPLKKKRSLAGHPDPDAEVIALSPKSLLATNRFVCDVCSKGFQRDQNLQLHRRGHNLPWRLKQKESSDVRKKVYVCPEPSCVHHDPARALGDLTGIKKHFCRKHGEKKWKCERCTKKYAVHSDWKAHQKVCGTREYRCDCGTVFSRRDSFVTHRAYCDALAENNTNDSPTSKQHGELHHIKNHPDDNAMTPSSATDLRPSHTSGNGQSHNTSSALLLDSTSPPISQLTGEALTPQEGSKSVLSDQNMSDTLFPAEDHGNTSLPSRWADGGLAMPDRALNKDPRLCLSLATGIVPSCSLQVDGKGKLSSPSTYPSVIAPSNETEEGDRSRFSIVGESYESTRHQHASEGPDKGKDSSNSSSMHAFVPSTGAMDLLASLFSSSKGYIPKSDAENQGEMGQRVHPSQHSAPISSSSLNDFRSTKGSTPMSATALLHKAAQMGAKASNLSFLQKFGVGKGAEASTVISSDMVERQAGLSFLASTYSKTGDMRMSKGQPPSSSSLSSSSMLAECSNLKGTGASNSTPFSLETTTSTYGSNFEEQGMLRMNNNMMEQANARPAMDSWIMPQPATTHQGNGAKEGKSTQLLDFLGVEGAANGAGMMAHHSHYHHQHHHHHHHHHQTATGGGSSIGTSSTQFLFQKDIAATPTRFSGNVIPSNNRRASEHLYPGC